MKIKGLLLGMFACAALASCTNNDLVEDSGVTPELKGDAYIAVSIVNPESGFGRAATAGEEEVGTAAENSVDKAAFVFFDKSGNYVTKVQIAGTELNLSEDKQKSEAVLVLNNTTATPTQVVAFLNPPAGLNLDQSLKGLMAAAGAYGYNGERFVMSNSAYKVDKAVQVATPITSEHIKKSAEEAIKSPVDIYVERVLAKVTVTDKNLEAESTEVTLNGVKTTLTPKITGWTLSGTNKNSFALKNLTTAIEADWVWGTNRSFWAEDVNYDKFVTSQTDDLEFSSYENVDGNKPETAYCLENTLTYDAYQGAVAYTHLLVTAKIFNEAGNEYLETFCSYNGEYYTEESLKEIFVSGLTEYKNGEKAITTDDIEFVKAGTSGAKAYMAKAQFKKEGVTVSEDAVAALNAKGQFMMYTDGKCYFWTAIEHFGEEGETGSIGVVRNHIYKLNLTAIQGLGTPVVDPTEPIIPEKPSDDNSYLAARINILSWKIVNQDVVLK